MVDCTLIVCSIHEGIHAVNDEEISQHNALTKEIIALSREIDVNNSRNDCH